MKPPISILLWQYLTEFFLEWEIFQTKVAEEIKIHVLSSIYFSRKSSRLWRTVEKYGRSRQATDGTVIRRMCFECWIPKATDTHSEYVILIPFPRRQWLRERVSILRCCHYITQTGSPFRLRTKLIAIEMIT